MVIRLHETNGKIKMRFKLDKANTFFNHRSVKQLYILLRELVKLHLKKFSRPDG